AGGFTEMGKQGKIKGKDMSLPDVLNASLFTKIRYQKSNGKDLSNQPTIASGEWQFPDEFALLFGGRVTENIGYMLEGQLANGAAPFLAGFKMPMMFPAGGLKVGVVPYTTDALGASYGFELLNTGAVRNVRISEHRNETSAQQYIGTATAAMGAAFVVWDPKFFVNVSKWSANHVAVAEERANGNPSSTYARAAFTPSFGGWDLGVGVQSWSGSSKHDDDTGTGTVLTVNTKAWAVDAQAQGVVGGMPLGVYLTHARAPGSAAGAVVKNLFNTNPNAKKATVITAELGVLPNKATVLFAYRWADTGGLTNSRDNGPTLGATYQLSQNVQLQLVHSKRSRLGYAGSESNGDRLTTFMLSAGF
ncbi:MAG: hypothetical protein HY778_03165, partial [Betaproteobacteria bacterium]|nr:hypothetical protein [Betaproteobacteria bacterium]